MNRQCAICGQRTLSSRYYFCTKCYKIWYLPNKEEPWIKFLMAEEKKRGRLEKLSQNDIYFEDIENVEDVEDIADLYK